MKHKYSVEELKDMLLEAEDVELCKSNREWEAIRRRTEQFDIPMTAAERWEKYPPRHVVQAGYGEYEETVWGSEAWIMLFTPTLIFMFLVLVLAP